MLTPKERSIPVDRSFGAYLSALRHQAGLGFRLLAVGCLVAGLLVEDGPEVSDALWIAVPVAVALPLGFVLYRTGRVRVPGVPPSGPRR